MVRLGFLGVVTSFFISSFSFAEDGPALKISKRHLWKNEAIFLTYPRSGTNLVIGLVQFYTHKKAYSVSPRNWWPNRISKTLEQNSKYFWHTHCSSFLKDVDSNNNKLILILRNYKECLIRNNLQLKQPVACITDRSIPYPISVYAENVKTFDGWNTKKRLLIYYEDLLKNPIRELQKILIFLGYPNVKIDLDEYKVLSEKILEGYSFAHRSTGGSHTKGKSILHHSSQISFEQKLSFDTFFKNYLQKIFRTYLGRYEELKTRS